MIYYVFLMVAFLFVAIIDSILYVQLLKRMRKLEKRIYDIEFTCPRLNQLFVELDKNADK